MQSWRHAYCGASDAHAEKDDEIHGALRPNFDPLWLFASVSPPRFRVTPAAGGRRGGGLAPGREPTQKRKQILNLRGGWEVRKASSKTLSQNGDKICELTFLREAGRRPAGRPAERPAGNPRPGCPGQTPHTACEISIYLSIYLSLYLSIYRSIYLSIYRSIYLATWLAS